MSVSASVFTLLAISNDRRKVNTFVQYKPSSLSKSPSPLLCQHILGSVKNVFNIYNSTQNKKGKTSSIQNKKGKENPKSGFFELNKEKIILNDRENSNNNEGKYDYDFNKAMKNKEKTILSNNENSNPINSDYSD